MFLDRITCSMGAAQSYRIAIIANAKKQNQARAAFYFFQIVIRGSYMADVQKEYGYTAQANNYIEALAKIRIPGEANQCLLVIQRKTWGWNKKQDAISLSQFVEATGICKPHVCRALSILTQMNMIIITKKGNDITEYAIQKDFEKWKPLPKKVTLPKKVMTVTKKGNHQISSKMPNISDTTAKEGEKSKKIALPKKVHTKDIIKPTITKDIVLSPRKIENIIPPRIEWVTMYFQEKGITGEHGQEESEKFIDHYTNTQWRIGGSRNKMIDWKAAVRNWIKNLKKWNRSSIKRPENSKIVNPNMTKAEKIERYQKADDTERLLNEIKRNDQSQGGENAKA